MSDISGTDLSNNLIDNTPTYQVPNIPSFLIAMIGNKERAENIQKLKNRFNPFLVKAILNNSPQLGNCLSHLQVARFAKLLFPDKPYLVLEDDAEVKDENFWELVSQHPCDLLYFGYNGECTHTKPVNTNYVWGTHAVVVSSKARDAIIEHFEWADGLEYWTKEVGFDAYLTVIADKANLTTWKPEPEDRYKYICQKDGFISFLSGHIRKNNL